MKSTWFLVIAGIAAPCVAQDTIPSSYATQESWSGGPDWSVIGESEWSNTFIKAVGIDWYNNSGALTLAGGYQRREMPIDSSLRVTEFSATDVDMDGDVDLFILQGWDDSIGWLENNDGSMEWSYHDISTQFYNPRVSIASDFNNDNLVDLALISDEDGLFLVSQNENGSWNIEVIDRYFYGGWDIECGDIDEDGWIDIATVSRTDGYISWWKNPGPESTEWSEHIIVSGLREPSMLMLGDYIGDRDREVYVPMHDFYCYSQDPSEVWTELSIQRIGEGRPINKISVYNLAELSGYVLQKEPGLFLINMGMGEIDTLHFREYYDLFGPFTYGDIDRDGDVDLCTIHYCYENISGDSVWLIHPYSFNPISSSSNIDDFDISDQLCFDIDGNGSEELIFIAKEKLWFVDHLETPSEGVLESQVFHAEDWHSWQSISWVADEPEGTSISFFIHFYHDRFPDWIGPISESCSLTEYNEVASYYFQDWVEDNPDSYYFQYKVVMESTVPGVTPSLHSVTVEWK